MQSLALNHKEIDFKEPIKTKSIQGSYKKKHKDKARGKRYVLSYDNKNGRKHYYKNTIDEITKTLKRALTYNEFINYITIYDIEENVKLPYKNLL